MSDYLNEAWRLRREHAPAFVYMMVAEDGRFKVGASRAVQERLAALSRQEEQGMTLIAAVASCHGLAAERRVHNRLDAFRIAGPNSKREWYRMTDAEAATVPGIITEEAEDNARAARLLASPLSHLVDTKIAARALGVGRDEVRMMCRTGRLPFHRFGTRYKIERAVVARLALTAAESARPSDS